MSQGPITPQEALTSYGSFRLASHIDVYRKAGYRIRTEIIHEKGREFARYIYEGTNNV